MRGEDEDSSAVLVPESPLLRNKTHRRQNENLHVCPHCCLTLGVHPRCEEQLGNKPRQTPSRSETILFGEPHSRMKARACCEFGVMKNGRPVRARTADLYRVKVAL